MQRVIESEKQNKNLKLESKWQPPAFLMVKPLEEYSSSIPYILRLCDLKQISSTLCLKSPVFKNNQNTNFYKAMVVIMV